MCIIFALLMRERLNFRILEQNSKRIKKIVYSLKTIQQLTEIFLLKETKPYHSLSTSDLVRLPDTSYK